MNPEDPKTWPNAIRYGFDSVEAKLERAEARVAELEVVAQSNITGIEAFVSMLPGKGTDEERVVMYRAATVELLMHFRKMPDQSGEGESKL